jgi:hypothetical protein
VVSRGGIWDIIQSSIAARIATAAPMITCTVIAVVPWKPKTQGETSVHILDLIDDPNVFAALQPHSD